MPTSSAAVMAGNARAALVREFTQQASSLEARLMLDRTNASLVSSTAGAALARAVHQLLAGAPVRLYVVGGSASAGAGGAGINRTFDARLTTKLNQLLEHAERSSQKPLGRVLRSARRTLR